MIPSSSRTPEEKVPQIGLDRLKKNIKLARGGGGIGDLGRVSWEGKYD